MRAAWAGALLLAVQAGPMPPYVVVDLRTGQAVSSSQAGSLETPIAPGSVMKIVTLVAALESDTITPKTAILCKRDLVVDGRRVPCTHPDLHRALGPAEALAHSCNYYFATVASRLPRGAFDRALATLGLPSASGGVSLPLEALGLDGVRATPRALLDGLARLAQEPSDLKVKRETLDTVRDGLRGATSFGTAIAFKHAGVEALGKTGTAPSTGGVSRGLVIAVAPARNPTLGIALVAPGAAGVDAAALAAPLLKNALQQSTGNSRQPSVNGQQSPAERRPPTDERRPTTDDRRLTTVIRVGFARPGGGYSVVSMPLETYVARVLAGEAAQGSGPAALEALAITIRTYALANLERHRADGFDLCDLTHCQVVRSATPSTEQAARATANAVLLYRGAPAQVFYTASCGGRSELPSAVWPGADDPPFLASHDDPAGDVTPWTTELRIDELERTLGAAGFRGRLREMRVISKTGSGRVAVLRLSGLSPDEISGQDLRTAVGRILGWQYIKSAAFDLSRTSTGYRFSGRGSGHGVGLCQIGSAALAAKGRTRDQILATYFPGLVVGMPGAPGSPVAPPPEVSTDIALSLPAGDEGERNVVVALAARARDDLARRLGTPAPGRLVLRFHPTVEAYQRATGEAWYTAGATVGDEIHFVPLTVLRERGVLERTLRHEIVHRLTAGTLASRPLWVREGVAIYFAGERQVPGGAPDVHVGDPRRVECPSDAELQRPVSPGALSNAYARAGGCVERQIAAGRKWNEVR